MSDTPAPVRAITRGPKFHWFAYYDKLQFDPSGRFVLSMEVDFEGLSPRPDDVIEVGMIDLEDGDRWIELGETRAWCWQQGCMLQWRPGSDDEVVWNDREGDRFVCHVLNVKTGERRTIPWPIYTFSPDGRTAVTPDFRRVNDMRPGYGYCGLPDPHAAEPAPEDSGLWRVDLDTGEAELVVTIAEVARLPFPHGDLGDRKHYFNHLLFNTDGTRFEFLHRWRDPEDHMKTRMLTASVDGGDIRVVDDEGHTSHFIWRDPEHILAWAYHPSHENRFYLYRDGSREVEVVAPDVMVHNGHCSYLPGGEWILNDTYPLEERLQELYVYHIPTSRKVTLGHFHSPERYAGEWRCDLHPRFSPDGTKVTIDSTHEEQGRQIYLVDVREATG